MSDSVTAFGAATANNTTGGQAVATIPAASLPAGFYRLDVYTQMTAIANPSVSNNLQLQAGATAIVRVINHVVAQNSGAYGPKQPLSVWRTLDGNTPVTANFVANCAATETQDWAVTIVATRVDYGGGVG